MAKSPGIYRVVITNSCGKSKESEAVKVINSCFAANAANASIPIQSKQPFRAIEIYPNPASDKTTIRFNADGPNETSIKIFNSRVELVSTIQLSAVKGMNNFKLNTEKLSTGLYYLELIINGKSEHKKLQIIK